MSQAESLFRARLWNALLRYLSNEPKTIYQKGYQCGQLWALIDAYNLNVSDKERITYVFLGEE